MPDPSTAPVILAIGRALPPHRASQAALSGMLKRLWEQPGTHLEPMDRLHRATKVQVRHLALPLDDYLELDSFQKANDAWQRVGAQVGEQAICDALSQAGLTPRDVGHFFFATVTGVSTPSLDATLANRLRMARSVRRTPVFGLGCVAGAAVLARSADLLRSFPHDVALFLSVELCSLTLQRDDTSMANLVASGLFGDGAAAVLLGGGRRFEGRGPRVLATASALYPNTEWVMGWQVLDSGFKVVLSPKVPELVREHLRHDVDLFLAGQGLTRRDIAHWICHPGGPKVLQAIEESLELPPGALDRSWRSLSEVGNLSSASVLFILGDTLQQVRARPGDLGLMTAMGPGFGAELLLLQW